MFDPRFIHWYDGMFLMPQHFQQNDLLFYSVNRYFLNNFNKFCWGVKEISIDKSTLAENIFRLNSIECVFQTGDIAVFNDGSTEFLNRNLKSNIKSNLEIDLSDRLNEISNGNMKVYMCISNMISERYEASDLEPVVNLFSSEQENLEYVSKMTLKPVLILSK
jgi:predicted component of type VI protein secretion system